mmetsp:Transcript_96151/g.294112  ORF Transcript_96151/g.294112 Transcript_96151/m.294112 type:complete len:258 (+) Transcript_96151:174-947(+)
MLGTSPRDGPRLPGGNDTLYDGAFGGRRWRLGTGSANNCRGIECLHILGKSHLAHGRVIRSLLIGRFSFRRRRVFPSLLGTPKGNNVGDKTRGIGCRRIDGLPPNRNVNRLRGFHDLRNVLGACRALGTGRVRGWRGHGGCCNGALRLHSLLGLRGLERVLGLHKLGTTPNDCPRFPSDLLYDGGCGRQRWLLGQGGASECRDSGCVRILGNSHLPHGRTIRNLLVGRPSFRRLRVLPGLLGSLRGLRVGAKAAKVG